MSIKTQNRIGSTPITAKAVRSPSTRRKRPNWLAKVARGKAAQMEAATVDRLFASCDQRSAT